MFKAFLSPLFFFLLLPFVAFQISSSQAAEQSASPDRGEVIQFTNAAVAKLMGSERLQGVSAVLVFEDGERWTKAYGIASKNNDQAFSTDSSIALHELAMLFTATAIMQLVEQEKLDLDTPFNHYIPEFTPFVADAGNSDFTIRQLLSHHSGIAGAYLPNFSIRPNEAGELPLQWEIKYRDLLNRGDEISMLSAPGEVYDYSYLGYVLLGLLIENVSGIDYSEYIEGNILQPLGMHNTHFGSAKAATTPFSSAFRKKAEEAHSLFRDIPANGLISTADDMSIFIAALISGGEGILAAETLAEMFRPQNKGVAYDGNFEMGLGFFISPVVGGKFVNRESISHAADLGKTQAYFSAIPEQNLGVLFTTNTVSDSIYMRDLADDVLAEMLKEVTGESLEAYSQHNSIEPNDRDMDVLLGKYSTLAGIGNVVKKGKKLKLELSQISLLSVRLLPREEDYYGLKIKLFGILPISLFPFLGEYERNIELKAQNINGLKYFFIYYRGSVIDSFSEYQEEINGSDDDIWLAQNGDYAREPNSNSAYLRYDTENKNYLFGGKGGLLHPFDIANTYCVVSPVLLKRCGRGLAGQWNKNVLRYQDDGRLLDAYGFYYSLGGSQ